MTYKHNWYKDSSYIYEFWEKGGNKITFKFPNAATDTQWTTWLYKYSDGKMTEKNLEAEYLQCFIDAIQGGNLK